MAEVLRLALTAQGVKKSRLKMVNTVRGTLLEMFLKTTDGRAI